MRAAYSSGARAVALWGAARLRLDAARLRLDAARGVLVGAAAPRWRAARACSRRAARSGWSRLPEAWQSRALDGAARARAALLRLWLSLLALATVRTDPMGWALRPIPVHVGRGRTAAAIHLAAAATPLQLRTIAYFWRNPHDHTCQTLRALLVGHGGDPATPLDVSGAVVSPRAAGAVRALPLAFRLQIDLASNVCTLTHALTAAAAATGATTCAHAAAAAKMNSAAIDDVLGPLLGRRLCPALVAGAAKAE